MESFTFCAVLAFAFAKATEAPVSDFFSRLLGVPVPSDSEDLRLLRGVAGEAGGSIVALDMSPDRALGRCVGSEG